jgi:hypothetical protein
VDASSTVNGKTRAAAITADRDVRTIPRTGFPLRPGIRIAEPRTSTVGIHTAGKKDPASARMMPVPTTRGRGWPCTRPSTADHSRTASVGIATSATMVATRPSDAAHMGSAHNP